ncbi:hypothetical protein [Paenibacillus sp. XY044]|uniref:hypothetical protein n=1 Tax=Paenibacillus sp. XY044 TaxID=2026089 RepID=UPI000B9807E2|nr:hypothetical protein [Paenibacillus sp. XY044]OZB94128.1 hypothetical protein CJP46_18090 [Paenibacillus sp. XY044]
MNYLISEKIAGQILNRCSYEQQQRILPEVIQILTRMKQVKSETIQGYGAINSSGDGTYTSWRKHIIATYAEEKADNF